MKNKAKYISSSDTEPRRATRRCERKNATKRIAPTTGAGEATGNSWLAVDTRNALAAVEGAAGCDGTGVCAEAAPASPSSDGRASADGARLEIVARNVAWE